MFPARFQLWVLSPVSLSLTFFRLPFLAMAALTGTETPKVVEEVTLGSFVEDRFPAAWLDAFLEALGTDRKGDVELFSEIPVDVIEDTIKGLVAKDDEGNEVKIKPLEMGALKVFCKKVKASMTPPAPEEQKDSKTQVVPVEPAPTVTKMQRKVAEVLDQLDDGQYDPLTDEERRTYFSNYIRR